MTEEELKKIWAGNRASIQLDMTQIAKELQQNMDHINQKVRSRDRRESMASIFGMVVFTFLLFYVPWPITKVACGIAVGWFAYVIYRLRRDGKQPEPDMTLPYGEQLKQRKLFLQKQAKLLNDVLYWYVLPPFLMNAIFFAGIGDPSTWDSPLAEVLPDTAGEKILILSFLAIFYGFIVWMNRKTARTYYVPLIKDIERVEAELATDE